MCSKCRERRDAFREAGVADIRGYAVVARPINHFPVDKSRRDAERAIEDDQVGGVPFRDHAETGQTQCAGRGRRTKHRGVGDGGLEQHHDVPERPIHRQDAPCDRAVVENRRFVRHPMDRPPSRALDPAGSPAPAVPSVIAAMPWTPFAAMAMRAIAGWT